MHLNTVGLPYGAVLTLVLVGNDPIDLNISSVFLCPYFKYVFRSVEDLEQNLSKRPGSATVFDTSNLLMMITANFVRNSIRMNDNLKSGEVLIINHNLQPKITIIHKMNYH